MIDNIKQFFINAWNWTKRKVKTILIWTGIIGVAVAAGVVDNPTKDISFQQLSNVLESEGGFKITYNEYSEVDISKTNMSEVTLRKWGDETYIKISPSDEIKPTKKILGITTDIKYTQENGKLKMKGDDTEIHLYPLEAKRGMEEGGFEYEIILKEKPVSNVIELNIETQGLNFYYQSEISDERAQNTLDWAIKIGAKPNYPWKDSLPTTLQEAKRWMRPVNVLGSYAVYHKTQVGNYEALGGKNYKTGKAYHIYRPQIEDSNGWKVWGELNINEKLGKLYVAMPIDFWNNASYPIKHAAGLTFGWTADGGTDNSVMAIRATHGTPAEAGTATKITAWISGGSSEKFQAAIYKGTALQSPQTEEIDNWSSASPETEEKDLDFTNGPAVTTDKHSVAIWSDLGISQIVISEDNVSDAGILCNPKSGSLTYNDWCSPMGSDCCDFYYDYDGDFRYSLYATYDAEGPPAAAAVNMEVIMIQ